MQRGGSRERERKKGLKVTQIILQQTYWTVTHGQDVPRWTDCDPLQAECPSHLDLLECLFQLWTLHCFFGAYHLGFAMSDQLKAEWDYLGVLCTAVLPVDWQLHWWCFQTHVSIHIRCNHQLVRWCSLGLWSLKQFLIFFFLRLFSALSALFVSAVVISIIFAIIPLCNNVLLLAIAMAVSGLAMGIIDTIANIQLVTIYQRDSAVFLQVNYLQHKYCLRKKLQQYNVVFFSFFFLNVFG